jgi:arylsulfatase A-like enzyme
MMNRRDFLRALGVGAAAGAAAMKRGYASPREKPNVLLIAVDDLNDWIGCYGGHPQTMTPNMDRLAKRSVIFTNAHCPAPICNPSRPSMMTGLLPSTTGHYFLKPDFETVDTYKDATTMPQYFAGQGYRTLGTGKIFHNASDHRPFFDKYGPKGNFGPRPEKKISYPQGHPLWDWGPFPEKDEDLPDHQIASWAVDQLKGDFDQPYFMAAGFYRPHVPMYVPQKWFDMHPREKIKLPTVFPDDRADVPKYGRDLTVGVTPPPHGWIVEHNEWEHAVQAYLACITFVDDCVGRVLDALDARDDADNTVIVFFSDHGFHMGEKQYWAKRSLWDRATKVPMMIAAPGVKGDRKCGKPVGLIDVYNTLTDLCGLPENDRLEGQSLQPLLEDPNRKWPRPALTTFGQNNHGLRFERWRYIQYADGSQELYDHENDPNEWHNLAGDPKSEPVIAELKKWLPKVNLPECPGTTGSGWQASEYAQGRRTLDDLFVE